MGGYAGKFLHVDLKSGLTEHFSVPVELLHGFIGGSGLAAALFLDRFNPTVEPFSTENPLMIMTGPLTGTNFPGSSRFTICGKSPLTNIWGESAIGGNFSPKLKMAGYDGIVFVGASDTPVALVIDDDRVELTDAGHLWGRDTYETTDILKGDLGNGFKVLCIGQAGENQVHYAAIANDKAHFAGRTGMGALMGSKKLKAIAVRGTRKIAVHDPQTYNRAFKSVTRRSRESVLAKSYHELGTNAGMEFGMMNGNVPIRNWTEGENWDLSEKLGGSTLTEKYLVRTHTCSFCPIACKRVVKVEEGSYQVEEGPGPEYETCATFGTLILNDNLAAVAKANEMCNRYGMDTISCGSTIAFAMECYERGILTPQDTDGLKLEWGDMDVVLSVLDKIAYRQGFGDLLANGSRQAAEKLGNRALKYAVQVKGLEAPAHDPRAYHGMGLAYAYSNRGACHMQHNVMSVEHGMVTRTELGLQEDYEARTSEGKAAMVFTCENYGTLLNALCQCHFVNYMTAPKDLLDALNATTGWDFTLGDLMACGERIWLLKRGLNNLMGINDADDILPKRILTPVQDGSAAGSVPDIKKMKKEYKELRGLNEKGFPAKEKLGKMGLENLVDKLYL
jgi:aldehyde:ferredoxin oxidoreductase